MFTVRELRLSSSVLFCVSECWSLASHCFVSWFVFRSHCLMLRNDSYGYVGSRAVPSTRYVGRVFCRLCTLCEHVCRGMSVALFSTIFFCTTQMLGGICALPGVLHLFIMMHTIMHLVASSTVLSIVNSKDE